MTADGARGTTVVPDEAVRGTVGRITSEAVPGTGTRATGSPAGLDVRDARDGVTAPVAAPVPAPAAETVAPGRSSQAGRVEPSGDARASRRRWTSPRVPVMLSALVALAACGALVADVLLAHLVHRPAAAWRTETLHRFFRHSPGDATVLAGAVVVLGLLMIASALALGHRRATVRAGLPFSCDPVPPVPPSRPNRRADQNALTPHPGRIRVRFPDRVRPHGKRHVR